MWVWVLNKLRAVLPSERCGPKCVWGGFALKSQNGVSSLDLRLLKQGRVQPLFANGGGSQLGAFLLPLLPLCPPPPPRCVLTASILWGSSGGSCRSCWGLRASLHFCRATFVPTAPIMVEHRLFTATSGTLWTVEQSQGAAGCFCTQDLFAGSFSERERTKICTIRFSSWRGSRLCHLCPRAAAAPAEQNESLLSP